MLNTALMKIGLTAEYYSRGYQAFDNYIAYIARDSAEIRWVSGPEGKLQIVIGYWVCIIKIND